MTHLRCIYNSAHVVDPDTGGERKIGIEVKSSDPGRRGGSDIKFRQPLNPPEWVCWKCIERLRMGLSVEQESLL